MNRTIEQWRCLNPYHMIGSAVALKEACNDIIALHEALTEIRDRLVDHPAYEELTEDQETEIGGDTADLSYLARVANTALMEKPQ